MTPPKDKPNTFEYHTPAPERTGPSTLQVFGGLFCCLLGLAPLAGGLAAAGAIFFRLFRQDEGRPTLSAVTGPTVIAAVLLWTAYVMFRMARRLFKGHRNAGQD